jgi:hypothetical protein
MASPPATGLGPTSEKVIYQDGWGDRLFIGLFSHKMAKALGKTGPRHTSPRGSYDSFVTLSKQIMQGRNPQQQQALVAVVLRSLVPAQALWLVRTLFSPTPLVCELNAWFATRLFQWLVGPCEVKTVEMTDPQGHVRQQRSGVHIKKCRYLDESRCVGLCVNMCKLPTQRFFTEDFGIPLTMVPNFEDFSCEMIFGQPPPPLAEEAVAHQPCLLTQCGAIAASSGQPAPLPPSPCPQVNP